jgi:predicted nucleic acid-binding protein
VVDASALVEFLLRAPRPRSFDRLLTLSDTDLHVPGFCDLEVVSALRSVLRRNRATVQRAEKALRQYLDLPLTRHSHEGLVHRCFELRDVLSPYDASYVALAEALEADLVTADRRLARSAAALGVSCLPA